MLVLALITPYTLYLQREEHCERCFQNMSAPKTENEKFRTLRLVFCTSYFVFCTFYFMEIGIVVFPPRGGQDLMQLHFVTTISSQSINHPLISDLLKR